MRRRIFPERYQQGYILLPVVMAICLIAGIAFLMNTQTGLHVHMTAGEASGDRARYAAEAGLNHMVWHLQQDNCSGYTDLVDVPFGNDRYSVTVTDESGNPVTTGSPVVLTATATLADGTTSTLVRHDVKIYGPGTTVVDLLPSKDARILATEATTNFGDSLYLTTNGMSGAAERTLLEFDLSSIPAGTTIDAAAFNMYLYFWNGKNDTVKTYKVTSDWTEGDGAMSGVTWNYRNKNGPVSWTAAGGDYDTATVGTFNIKSTGWYSMDLTTLVQGWLDGSAPNHGIILAPPLSAGNHLNYYHSRENTYFANLRPKLTVTYYGRTECH
jgi:hypothetical protein